MFNMEEGEKFSLISMEPLQNTKCKQFIIFCARSNYHIVKFIRIVLYFITTFAFYCFIQNSMWGAFHVIKLYFTVTPCQLDIRCFLWKGNNLDLCNQLFLWGLNAKYGLLGFLSMCYLLTWLFFPYVTHLFVCCPHRLSISISVFCRIQKLPYN